MSTENQKTTAQYKQDMASARSYVSAELKKHGIDFAEAKSAFADEQAKIIPDPDHSEDEDRFILIGLSLHLKLLVVCHCYREQNNSIRIISARKATKPESRQY